MLQPDIYVNGQKYNGYGICHWYLQSCTFLAKKMKLVDGAK